MEKLITILGPTASGKTKLAVQLAHQIDGEIISADSRQVYRGMDIGTGKDLEEYTINGSSIPYHLIDVKKPGYEYNVFEFQQDFLKAYKDITKRGKIPILCGGTGMYLSAALASEQMVTVPEDTEFRLACEQKTDEELIADLSKLKELHNTTDSVDRERIIRAIEIESYKKEHKSPKMPIIKHYIFGIDAERTIIKQKITKRLMERLNTGMLKEVEELLSSGITPEQLKFYGLEYKYVTEFIEGELNFNDMYQKLNTAIHVFAKKQMTWFRRMQKQGTEINWLKDSLSTTQKIKSIREQLVS